MKRKQFTFKAESVRIAMVAMLLLFVSCVASELTDGKRTINANISTNSPNGLSSGQSRVLYDNPTIILNRFPGSSIDRTQLVTTPAFITNNSILTYDCGNNNISNFTTTDIEDCFFVKQTESDGFTSQNQGTWGYHPNTDQFLEVNAYYHIRLSAEKYFAGVDNTAIFNSNTNALSALVEASTLNTAGSDNIEIWYDDNTQFTPELKVFSNCDADSTGAFYSARNQICLGNVEGSSLNFTLDPTIIQHEMGHYLLQTMFNMRTITDGGIVKRLDFGGFQQSEKDILSEGIADWFSHYMTGRNSLFEWIGRVFQADRPMRENNGLHTASFVSTDDQDRVKYPEFIKYDAYDPDFEPFADDAHFGGQIISHFLVDFENELVSRCALSFFGARDVVFFLLQETLSELGDLSSSGEGTIIDANDTNLTFSDNVNMTSIVADEWANKNRPINVRSFIQTFSKKFIFRVNSSATCNGNTFSQDAYEEILDKYGLLLFKTYNTDLNNEITGHDDIAVAQNQVNSVNRVQTVLVAKENLVLNPNTPVNGSPFFIVDDPESIEEALANLILGGVITADDISTQPTTNTGNGSDLGNAPRNNANGRIGPGEIVGIALDLKNNANTPIAGVEILANPWDHTKYDNTDGHESMCNTFEDAFPLSSEGAASDTDDTVPGNCSYITRFNGQGVDGSPTLNAAGDDVSNDEFDGNENIAPICFVYSAGDTNSEWVSQAEFIEENGISDNNCLEAAADNNECLFRPIPGMDVARYSLINPGSTWQDTFSEVEDLDVSNVILFEVSNMTPPGTTFNCRFRARFTNCDDCWHDSDNGNDDYLDYEFAGDKPFRIFNIQFTVLD